MVVIVKARHFSLSPALSEHVESKLRLMLGRYEQKINRVHVTLFDVNGPKGGEDMCCKLVIHPSHMPAIVVKELSTDMYDSINKCSHRAKRVLGRHINSSHIQQRKAV